MSRKTRSICIKVISLSLFLLFLQPAHSQDWDELNEEVEGRQKQMGKDLVMMLWKDTLVYKKELGGFNSKTQAPLGNSSAWLTAALVMTLVDEGKISLDDKVGRYLPEFERYGKSYITLRLCLSHMTGIEDKNKGVFQKKKFGSLEDQVNSFAAREIRANAGEDFWFGNIGINIAGRVLEIVSKKRFDVLAKQKLFNPLAMRRTSFTTLDASAVDPSDGAVSTPDDYLQFLIMMVSKGKYKGKQVISEESMEELIRIQPKEGQIKFAPEPANGFSYALGSWVVETKDGKASVLACPNFSGIWPMVDFCRGYAYLFFPKNQVDDQKAKAHMDLKAAVDGQVNCK
jgi:CubicO group peptidase (beta-lactamase class C family)